MNNNNKNHTAIRLTIVFIIALFPAAVLGQTHWVSTWGTALVARAQVVATPEDRAPATNRARRRPFGGPPLVINDQTLRQIIHSSIGGKTTRLVLSNIYGTAPLNVGAAQIALTDESTEEPADIRASSAKAITFDGKATVTVPPGAILLSDPIDFTVPALTNVAIDLYFPDDFAQAGSPLTVHQFSSQTNYVSNKGNYAGKAQFSTASTNGGWHYLARVEVEAPAKAGTVVTFGDSITDGTRSTTSANHRWPDFFARRLQAANIDLGVVNAGIAGNQVLGDGAGRSALVRFDRDALMQTGVTHVIVLESINDIGIARANPTPSAEDLIAGHKQLIARAHACGILIYGATLTPFDGAGYFSPEGEAKRQAVNNWIRTSGAYDGVVDFDAAVRDPKNPSKLSQQYNPGDNLHMNDSGYEAMANAIDLKLFKPE